jgi:CO dehydrogenase/acetyl-CoA synthase alpha subunit
MSLPDSLCGICHTANMMGKMKEEQNMNGEVSKRQRAVRIGRLTTLSEIATEIGRLYRAARQGKEDTLVAQRLATILTAMRQCLEIADVERHIADLEAAITAAAQSNVAPFRQKGSA